MSVVGQFDLISQKYDNQRRFLIPCFDAFYESAARALKEKLPPSRRNIKILDLGAGTGLMTQYAYSAFADSNPSVALLDLSPKMLEIARQRFSGIKNAQFIEGDFFSFSGKYDVICSALAIHHIENDDKKKLFAKIYDSLEDGGVFVNAEQILGKTPEEIAANAADRERIIREHFVSPAEAETARERLKLDRCATVEDNINWLLEAGFSKAECVFEHLDFAVICAVK